MEWTIRLEAKTGWGEVETMDLVSITRPVLAATSDDVGLSLADAKSLLASQGCPRVLRLSRSSNRSPRGFPGSGH